MQKFFQVGANLGYGQKKGSEAYVRCYTLHLLGGGGNAPPPHFKYSPYDGKAS